MFAAIFTWADPLGLFEDKTKIMRILIPYSSGDLSGTQICSGQQFSGTLHPLAGHILDKGLLHILTEDRTQIIGAHTHISRHLI